VIAHQRLWTTTVLPESDQFHFWREVVWEAFVPVTLASSGAGSFHGRVGASQIGPLGIAAIASEAQTVQRTAADVRRRPGDVFFLNMPLRGHSTVAQDGRIAELGPGDFAVVDGARPFSLDFGANFEQLSLILPHELLMPLLAAPEAVTGQAVRGDTGLGAVAGGALRPFFAGGAGFDKAMARPLAERLAALIALSLGGGAAASGSRAELTQAALDEIERSLGDAELTPAAVAARVGISTRYLHQLFSARGPSFGRWLLSRRLERCCGDLADPEFAHWTIGEIGWRNGFTDPSYLARAFRRAYGVSPGEHRRAAAARPLAHAVQAMTS
jgi:AraC family transcriptional regulator, positive regulator of tynA and feaB